jgi:hypothetical protein
MKAERHWTGCELLLAILLQNITQRSLKSECERLRSGCESVVGAAAFPRLEVVLSLKASRTTKTTQQQRNNAATNENSKGYPVQGKGAGEVARAQ